MVSGKALIAAAGFLAISALTPALACQEAAATDKMDETPLGLLIKTPETPHGISFSIQTAGLKSSATAT